MAKAANGAAKARFTGKEITKLANRMEKLRRKKINFLHCPLEEGKLIILLKDTQNTNRSCL